MTTSHLASAEPPPDKLPADATLLGHCSTEGWLPAVGLGSEFINPEGPSIQHRISLVLKATIRVWFWDQRPYILFLGLSGRGPEEQNKEYSPKAILMHPCTETYPKAQNSPTTLHNRVFGPKSLKI